MTFSYFIGPIRVYNGASANKRNQEITSFVVDTFEQRTCYVGFTPISEIKRFIREKCVEINNKYPKLTSELDLNFVQNRRGDYEISVYAHEANKEPIHLFLMTMSGIKGEVQTVFSDLAVTCHREQESYILTRSVSEENIKNFSREDYVKNMVKEMIDELVEKKEFMEKFVKVSATVNAYPIGFNDTMLKTELCFISPFPDVEKKE